MPTPRYSNRVRATQAARPAQSTQNAGTDLITREVVERADPSDSRYFVRGVATPTRVSTQLRAGDVVSVLWRRGAPFMILDVLSRRGPGTDEPFGAGGIVEELFVAPRADGSGVVDVHFRNDKQVTPLMVRESLPSDPVDARWGWDKKSFVVQCGSPAPVEFRFAPSVWINANAPQDQTYHVFAVKRNAVRVLGPARPQATLTASFSPSLSSLVVAASASAWHDHSTGGHEVLHTTFNDSGFVSEEHESLLLSTINSDGDAAANVTLGALLSQARGPAAVVDFFTDRLGHLIVVVRARARVGDEFVVTTTNTLQSPNGSASIPVVVTTSTSEQTLGEPGEAHVFVVDVTDETLLFATTDSEAVALEFSPSGGNLLTGNGAFTISGGGSIFHVSNTGSSPSEAYAFAGGWTLNPTGSLGDVSLGTIGSGGGNRWSDAWDEARFPFITESTLKRNGTAALGAQDLYRGNVRKRHFFWNNVTTVFPAPSPAVYAVKTVRLIPAPVKEAQAGVPFWIFLCVYRRRVVSPVEIFMDYSAYVIRPDGSVVATLLDWTPMTRVEFFIPAEYVALNDNAGREPMEHPENWDFVGPDFTFSLPIWAPATAYAAGASIAYGGVDFEELNRGPQSDMEGNDTAHDGARAAYLGGNQYHVLWETSTSLEREAGVRHVKLSKIGIDKDGAAVPPVTIDVGQDWAEFSKHDFLLMNLDVLYAAAPEPQDTKPGGPRAGEKPGQFFVKAWDLGSGDPTLAQNPDPETYPLEDKSLSVNKALKQRGDAVVVSPDTVPNRQAVNDPTVTARPLKPRGAG